MLHLVIQEVFILQNGNVCIDSNCLSIECCTSTPQNILILKVFMFFLIPSLPFVDDEWRLFLGIHLSHKLMLYPTLRKTINYLSNMSQPKPPFVFWMKTIVFFILKTQFLFVLFSYAKSRTPVSLYQTVSIATHSCFEILLALISYG